MKLVDILARELKAWPESWGIYCVSSKVDGAFAAWFGYRNPVFEDGGWSDIGTVEIWLSEEPEDRKNVVVRRFEWQAAVDALKADEYHEPDNGVEAWLHGVERDYGNDAAQKCRAIINEARLKLERSKACDAIYGVLTGATVERKGNTSDMAEALYDAGYRKFEIVDN